MPWKRGVYTAEPTHHLHITSTPPGFRVQEDKAWTSVLHPYHVLWVQQHDLPSMHSYPGCDSTSQFLGHGKRLLWNVFEKGTHFAMTAAGDEFPLCDTMSVELEKAVCIPYNCPLFSNTNEVRNYKWNRVKKDITKLPPCQDSLKLQLKRANCEAAVWKYSFPANTLRNNYVVLT